MMTIKEFYEWAVKEGVENAHFGISTSVPCGECGSVADYCEPVDNDMYLTVGGLYENGPIPTEEPFVWIEGKDLY